jgi:hypothetical protein
MITQLKGKRIFVLLVVLLFFNMPFISALDISDVRVEDVTDRSAVVKWETDESADSFVSYGEDKEELKTIGDTKSVEEHSFGLDRLSASTKYYFKIKSGETEDNKDGDFYTFKTLEKDTIAPSLEVELPFKIAGDELEVTGITEAGSEVRVYVNENMRGKVSAEEGEFSFSVSLLENEWNDILIEAEDKAGNVGELTGKVFADMKKPELELEDLPEVTAENTVLLKGKINEKCSIKIFVNERSVFELEGDKIEKEISLQEGKNEIKITVKDEAGWEVTEDFTVDSDTAPPQVRFELGKGAEYYQGRAETDISGDTEAGAAVYLYVYRRLGYEYKPEFDKAWMKVTADEEGKFTFKDVDLECKTCGLKVSAPKLVPAGLLDVSILPLETAEETQKWTYYVYVIAEDRTGKTGSAQRIVNVNTCYTANWAFDVQSIAQFQAPLRLDPGLLDEGREMISAWFNLSYRGDGVPSIDPATGRITEPAFKIVGVRFEKACTQGMQEDDAFKIGCNILPRIGKDLPNGDKTAHFVTWNLHSAAELSDAEDDFWNEFSKRVLMFPLKIMVSYRERAADGIWGETKTQVTCYDLGYFVDIPLDSQKLLPDWLVNEGVEGLEWGIDKIDTVKPYLEKAILVSGVGCIAGFLTKTVVRYFRIVTSKLEAWFTRLEPDKEKRCPVNQNDLYLESTIRDWEELEKERVLTGESTLPDDYTSKKLENKCPQTAGMWKLESALDQLYRWSCDRFLCRKVPAGWTSGAEEKQVQSVILKQQQCAVTSSGIPLTEVKDCQKFIEKQTVAVIGQSSIAASYTKSNPSYFCYQDTNGDLYIMDDSPSSQAGIDDKLKERGVFRLHLIGNIGSRITESANLKTDLLAYQPYGSNSFIIGKDITCKNLCNSPKKPGYESDTKNGDANGCYTEDTDGSGNIVLKDASGYKIRHEDVYSAGYTKDCFIAEGIDEMEQCVCVGAEEKKKTYFKEGKLRTAAKEDDGLAEAWSYRQAAIFRETNNKIGTYYPEWRYYSERDLSGAFGADYLLDYLNSGVENKEVHEVNPFTQHLGAFQSLCLTGINARLMMLRNVMQGLRDCLYEAKYTGLHDAGTCKTLFTQHVCGLIYKTIAYFFTGCSPFNFEDVGKEGAFEDVMAVAEAGFGSIPQAMQYSIDEIQGDYGNAKLNEFFATGVQGFAQSMCMAAFGFDFPMGFDFIMDAAYAVPMKTTVHVIPAERELATYNPKIGTVVYNYNVGAIILPGCKIRSYKVYLKAVGPEDAGRPGVQCGTQGCDSMNLMSQTLETQRTHPLEGGMGFELKQGNPVDLPILAPQKIDSLYRYDHVVIELQLDKFEDAEACFDEGYNDGKFYFPITDVSAPADVVCQVQPTTGKYYCPSLTSFFGEMGLAYLEDPYVTCWNKMTETWVYCETPNLFLKDDRIKVRAHVVSDGKGQCLKPTVSGIQQEVLPRLIPENVPGLTTWEFDLGVVNEVMLSGFNSRMGKISSESNVGCQEVILMGEAPSVMSSGTFRFYYETAGEEKYRLKIPQGVIVDSPYSKSGDYLTLGNMIGLSLDDINKAVLNLNGFKVKNVLGRADFSGRNQCVYQITGTSNILTSNYKDISARFDLMYQDETGGCYYTNQLVKTAVGKNSHTQRIRLQKDEILVQELTSIHEAFIGQDFDYVFSAAKDIVNQGRKNIGEVTAIYYLAAVDVIKWNRAKTGQEDQEQYKSHVKHLLNLFFNAGYPSEVIESNEYKKINCYLCKIADQLGITDYASRCHGVC